VVGVVVSVDDESGILPSCLKAPSNNCSSKDLTAFVNADEAGTRLGSGKEGLEEAKDFGGGLRFVEKGPTKDNTTGETSSFRAVVARRTKVVLSLSRTFLIIFRCNLIVSLHLRSLLMFLPRKTLTRSRDKPTHPRKVASAMKLLVPVEV
jgi:hypothetical protein